jgi:hypothetical protein
MRTSEPSEGQPAPAGTGFAPPSLGIYALIIWKFFRKNEAAQSGSRPDGLMRHRGMQGRLKQPMRNAQKKGPVQ